MNTRLGRCAVRRRSTSSEAFLHVREPYLAAGFVSGLAGRAAPEQPRSADDDTDKDDASEEAGEWQEVAYMLLGSLLCHSSSS